MSFQKIEKENILRNVIKTHPLVKITIKEGKSYSNIKNTENIVFSNIIQTNVGDYDYPYLDFSIDLYSMYLPII